MTILGFIVLILIGAVCGLIAQAIVGYSVGGLLASIAVGFLGALLGTWIADGLGLPSLLAISVDGRSIDVLWAILGAVLLLAILSLVRRRRVVYRG
jgi:uncharacterized membrane protein YeaQ/YmgE (transglycosylase-associated protein family)